MHRSENHADHYTNKIDNLSMVADQERPSENQNGNHHFSVLDEWTALLATPVSPDKFLTDLIRVQCRASGAAGGVWLQAGPENRVDILAIHPPLPSSSRCDQWVALAAADFARHVISTGKTSIRLESKSDDCSDNLPRNIIVVPIKKDDAVIAAAAFIVLSNGQDSLIACRDKLEFTPFLFKNNDLQITLNHRQADLVRVCGAMNVLSAFNRSDQFAGAATVLCNEMATRWQCNRVSLGFLKNRYIHVQAMSHTNEFSRKMKMLQDLEAVMEECLDQDMEIVYPTENTLVYVSRAAKQFSKNHGPCALVSLPVRYNGDVRAIMTLERSVEHAFTLDEIEAARLTCDLCSNRLVELQEQNQWFGARMALAMRKGMTQIFKPKYTLHKCLATLVFLFLVFIICAKGHYRVEAPFAFETKTQQAIAAPFDSYIKKVSVETGDSVIAGKTILGQLELSEQRLELAALKAEQIGYQKQNVVAMRDRKTADAQIAQAQIDKVAARIRILEEHLRQGTLVAPITGRIISKGIKQQIGAPVEAGTVLFEIASIKSLRAELYIPEDAISEISEGQKGQLIAVGHPNQKIPFTVERISPIADVVNQHNVFRVKVTLLEQNEWMRPGMEGVSKISIGKEPYVWIGSRRIINWLRMKLWF